MIYTHYIPLKNEVNKIMHNYAILANCRKLLSEMRVIYGKTHKNRERIFCIFWTQGGEDKGVFLKASDKNR